MDTLQLLYKAEDLLNLSDGRYELIEGVIHRMAPAGEEHGIITARIIYRLAGFVEKNRLGVITTSETGYKLSSNPDTVKAPDAAFKSNERLIKGGRSKGYSSVMPELVIEVNSPFDTYSEVYKKVLDWISAGVIQVWVIDPENKTVTVYDSKDRSSILHMGDELSAEDILSGFTCKISEFFEY